MNRNISLLPCTSILLIASFLNNDASGQIVWNNTTNTNSWYHSGLNWVGGEAPDDSDIARFSRFGNYEVWWDESTANSTPRVGGLNVVLGNVTFLNQDNSTQHRLSAADGIILSGSNTSLTNRGLFIELGFGDVRIQSGGTFIVDGSHAQGSRINTTENSIMYIAGNLNVHSGGRIWGVDGVIAPDTNSVGVVRFSGENSFWGHQQAMHVGSLGNGSLIIEDGAKVINTLASGIGDNSQAWVGKYVGSHGTVTVSGNGSEWNTGTSNYIDSGLYLANQGDGILNIEDGGKVTCRFLKAGVSADAILNVTAGGQINASHIRLGEGSAGTANARFAGTGTQIETVELFVSGNGSISLDGDATLTVDDGAVVNASYRTVVSEDNGIGIARLSGIGTTLNTGELWVGNRGTGLGSLSVEAGASLNTSSTSINRVSGNGAIRVSGTGTQWLNENEVIVGSGDLGGGELEIFDDAVFSVGTALTINAGSVVQIRDSGIAFVNDAHVAGELVVSNDGQLYGVIGVSTGTVINAGGRVDFGSDFNIEATGMIGGHGQFTADGGWINNGRMTFSGGPSYVDGHALIGSSGSLTFSSDSTATFNHEVTIADGSQVYFAMSGTAPGMFGQMSVVGDLTLDGILDISLVNGFKLSSNEEFLIVDIEGNRNGFFAGLEEGDLVGNYGGIDLFISYRAGNGNDIKLFTSVPEPGTIGFFGGLILILSTMRRKTENVS